MAAVVAHAHGEILGVLASHGGQARFGDAAPVVHVVLLEDAVDAVVVGAAPTQSRFQLVRHVLFQHDEVPELGLQRPSRVGQAKPQHAVGEQAVVAQVQTGAQAAQPPLRLWEGGAIVFLEGLSVLGGDAVGLADLVGALQETHGQGVTVDEQVLVLRLELLLVGQAGDAAMPPLHDDGGQVRGRHMVVVRAVVHRRLPVQRLDPLDGANGLGAVVQPVEADVQQPPRVAQVVVQAGRAVVPGGEHDAGVGVDPRLNQAQAVAVQRAVVGLLVAGHVFQRALVGEGPAVVGAGEVAGVAHVGADDAVAPVPAHVQVGAQAAPAVAAEDHRLLAHVGVEEIVGVGNQRLVADHEPGPPEYLLLLLGIDVRVNEYPSVQLSGLEIDYLVLAVHGNHRTPPVMSNQGFRTSINHPVHTVHPCVKVIVRIRMVRMIGFSRSETS